tara:strand:- start:364 stop:570 length:207 start_codon:yes stop_codon:yes gene_type:complete
MNKRSLFYFNGEMIPNRMPQDFRKAQGEKACGNCGMYSNRRSYCGVFKEFRVRDIYVCGNWRQRHFQR